jgi:dienelactone hydrolase
MVPFLRRAWLGIGGNARVIATCVAGLGEMAVCPSLLGHKGRKSMTR